MRNMCFVIAACLMLGVGYELNAQQRAAGAGAGTGQPIAGTGTVAMTPVDARELLLGVRQSAAAADASNDVPTPEEIEARQRMWRFLLAAVAVLLLAETIFANRGWRGTASRLSIAPSERSTS